MATELAQAYVQIIPSAQGISGKLTNVLDDEAGDAGESSGQTFASRLVSAAKAVIAAAGIGKALSAAITEGADLEQSIGGIETLFKESADTMKEYAAQAYQTAGISANDYMEQATSFAASLLQSLDGDTAAAAEAANQAIIDMSDNANKMGTSIENIQNAYQGFAKQNYTMLDNLKLGYGGTKEEMERLLEDAEKLIGIEYDIDNLSDVYEAIHVIQEDLGITGTTAEEAASTFSGSMASMQAAAKNFAGNLALGEDVSEELEALFSTAETFLVDNLLPMVGNILTSLPGLLPAAVEGAISLVSSLTGQLPEILSSLFSGITEALVTGLDAIGLDGVASKISEFADTISENFSLEDLLAKFQEIGDYLGETFSPVLDAIDGLFGTIFDVISDNITSVTDFASEVGESGTVADVLKTAAEGLATALTTVIDGISSLIGWLNSGNPLAEVFRGIVVGIAAGFVAWQVVSTVSTLISSVTSVVSTAKTAFAGLNATLSANPIAIVVTLITGLISVIVYLWNNCEGFRDAVTTIWENIQAAFSTAIEAIKGFIEGFIEKVQAIWDKIVAVKDAVEEALESIKGFFQNKLESAKSTVSTKMESIRSKFSEKMESAKSKVSSAMSDISGFFSSKLATAKSTVTSKMGDIADKFGEKMETAKEKVSNAIEKIKGFFDFSWSLPSLKLPHIRISGSFSLNPVSVPHFSISWYKKAMEAGMIMNSPTIFGYDSESSTFLAGGEAGSETVVGTQSLMDMIQNAVSNSASAPVVNIYIDGAQYDDVDDLTNQIAYKLQKVLTRKEAVFA